MSDFESLYGVDEVLNGNVHNHTSGYLHFRFDHLDMSTSWRRTVPIVVFYYFKYVVLKDRHIPDRSKGYFYALYKIMLQDVLDVLEVKHNGSCNSSKQKDVIL
jgi:hypothetical protein